ncbi:MAG: Ig-like domain-containing protein [Gemmatimonadales bacterium]|jgi:uncharacterized protein YjdB
MLTRHGKRPIAFLAASLLITAGCSEPPSSPRVDDPTVPSLTPDGNIAGMIVSQARDLTDATSRAFVSLEPGSLPDAEEVVLTIDASGITDRAGVVQGGFDPIALPASPNDRLGVEVFDALGLSLYGAVYLPIPMIPPVVVRTYPTKRRTSVPVNTSLLIVFSEPIRPSSVTERNIALRHSRGSVDVDFILTEGGTVVELLPRTDLQFLTDYTLEIGTGIEDLSGENLAQAEVVDFQTEPCVDLGDEPFAVRLLPDTLTLPVGSYSGFVVAVDSGARIINVFPDLSLTWGTTDPSVASVDWTGNVGAEAIGEAYVTVEYEGEVDSALVVVTQSPPPGPFRIFPDFWTTPVGVTVQFDVSHPEGTEPPNVSWSTTDPAVATVDDTGMVTSISPGLASIIATAGADIDTAYVEVLEPQDFISSDYTVEPGRIVLEVGSTFQLEILGPTPIPTFRWLSDDPRIATVDEFGLVTAVAPGTNLVYAAFEDGSGVGTEVAVTEVGDFGTITLDPSEVTAEVGDTIRFEIVYDSTAAALFGHENPGWSWSSKGQVLRLVGSAAFEALAPGEVNLTALVGPLQATAYIKVE